MKHTNKKHAIVVYTAIFGGYEGLLRQPRLDVDYICFSDRPLKESPWEVRVVKAPLDDPTRSARMYKILPHTLFPDYEFSIWIDGNYLVTSDVTPLINDVLKNHNMAYFNHAASYPDARDCIYNELSSILSLGQASGKYKDDPEIMRKQIQRYRKAGYPLHNGLIFSSILIRRHNAEDVIRTMNHWWKELSNGSKRDQLSFNYAAWKEQFNAYVINKNVRNNPWFFQIGKHRTNYRGKLLRYYFRRFLGLIKNLELRNRQ